MAVSRNTRRRFTLNEARNQIINDSDSEDLSELSENDSEFNPDSPIQEDVACTTPDSPLDHCDGRFNLDNYI